jgi:hypothetical protein
MSPHLPEEEEEEEEEEGEEEEEEEEDLQNRSKYNSFSSKLQ